MITPDKMNDSANTIVNIYSELEDRIFNIIIKALKQSRFQDVAKEDVLLWQTKQLSKMGVLNKKVIDLLAKYTGETQTAINQLIRGNGVKIVDEIDRELERMVHKSVPVSNEIDEMLDSFIRQTFTDLNNNVNQTLITTNLNENAVMRAYQAILKQSTMESMTGLKTHEQAVRDNVYKMVDMGIKSGFTDKAGREWSMEAYSRTVVQTTSHRTFNDLRLKRMEDFGCVTALMSSHPAAREACALIQGKWVLTVPKSEAPKEFKHLPSIYDHGYGDPGGTQGINCTHILYPGRPDVNTNNQPQYDPKEAQENAEIQQQQRKLERDIRYQKKRLMAAEELQDDVMQKRCKDAIRGKQKALRNLVKEHDFLNRDYSREQVQSQQESIKKEVKQTVKDRKANDAKEYETIRQNIGSKAPKSVEEYTDLKYNNKQEADVYKTIAESQKKNVSTKQQKQAAMDTYKQFSKDGVHLSDHALDQYQNRSRHEKSGRYLFNYQSVLSAANQPANFKSGSRFIKYYGKVALICEKNGRVVSIYRVNKPRKKWTSIK